MQIILDKVICITIELDVMLLSEVGSASSSPGSARWEQSASALQGTALGD